MKLEEKNRLIQVVKFAADQLVVPNAVVRRHVQKCADKYSPTNLERFRDLSESVWWLIALNAKADALQLLDAMCELNDEYYWMFQALATTFSTRSWLHAVNDQPDKSAADAQTALDWCRREPNSGSITEKEVCTNLKRFDDWIARAATERGLVRAAHVLSHALRVLVIYSQLSTVDAVPHVVEGEEYSERMSRALEMLRDRLRSE